MRVAPLSAADRAAWERLARGYKQFYQTPASDADYDAAWGRLLRSGEVHGLGASVDGALVGIAHYVFHASTWTERVCYLQDVFTAPAARGRGVGRALIESVASRSRARGATRFYWLTHEDNATARALYDRVATYHGFVRYDYSLPVTPAEGILRVGA